MGVVRRTVFVLSLAIASSGVLADHSCEKDGSEKKNTLGTFLLQTKSSPETSGQTPWYDWQHRLPELSRMDKVELWSALGAHWWHLFIDGRAHAKGLHAFDNKHVKANWDGVSSGAKTSENLRRAYESRKKHEAWGQKWGIDDVEALNSLLLDKNCTIEDCSGEKIYTHFSPRFSDDVDPWFPRPHARIRGDKLGTDDDHYLTSFLPFPSWDNLFEEASKQHKNFSSLKAIALADLLDDYYTGIANASLPYALPHLAKLYYRLADLHPFRDGNSRTRNFILQTELVELGGHPSSMWDMYWQVYFAPNLEAVESQILQGWCSWEMSYQTGTSPFVVAGRNQSVPYQTYDPDLQSCHKMPAPPNWFGKPF